MTEPIYSLCPECSACPEVVVHADGRVSIGEEGERITLEPWQWGELVRLIRSGELARAGV